MSALPAERRRFMRKALVAAKRPKVLKGAIEIIEDALGSAMAARPSRAASRTVLEPKPPRRPQGGRRGGVILFKPG